MIQNISDTPTWCKGFKIYTERQYKNNNLKSHMHFYVHCNIIYNSKGMKKPKHLLTDECIQKMWQIYATEYHSTIKKEWILTFAQCGKPWGHYVKWDKLEKKR